jgi:hypothetical protein
VAALVLVAAACGAGAEPGPNESFEPPDASGVDAGVVDRSVPTPDAGIIDPPSDGAADDAKPDAYDASPDAGCAIVTYDRRPYPIACWPSTLAIGDMDGDGLPDIVLTDLRGLSILKNLGSRAFAKEVSAPLSLGAVVLGLALVDIDGDHKLDAVVSDHEWSVVGALTNAGGVMRSEIVYPVGTGGDGGSLWAQSLTAGDLDGDGRPDVVVGLDDYGGETGGQIGVMLTRDGGVLSPETSYVNTVLPGPAGGTYFRGPSTLAIADLDGDGKNDVVVTTTDAHAGVYMNRGDGILGPEMEYVIGKDGVSGAHTRVAVGDLDGDGRPDLAIATNVEPMVGVLLNTGGGTFAPIVPVVASDASGSGYSYLAIADLDGDGKNDIVTSGFYGDEPGVSVLINKGKATFAPPVTYAADPSDDTGAMAVGDLDRDGLPDIVVAANGSCQVEVFYGRCQ